MSLKPNPKFSEDQTREHLHQLRFVATNSIEDYFMALHKIIETNFSQAYWKPLEDLRLADEKLLFRQTFQSKINELYLFYSKHENFVKFMVEQIPLSIDYQERFAAEILSWIMTSAKMNTTTNCFYFIK